MALGLRTIVIPTGSGDDTMYQYRRGPQADPNDHTRREWVMHLQVRTNAHCGVGCAGAMHSSEGKFA